LVKIRPFQVEDFELILVLADQAVPFAADGNKEWFEYRKAFDESQRVRHHYIAEENGQAVGYGCIEQQSDDPKWMRIFVVCPPEKLSGEVGSSLYHHLLEKAREISAAHLWAREYLEDRPINEFFKAQGFVETQRFELANDLPMVIFGLDLE
jgi:N-acetylglutamate synthase-like GNAT family acetyltransferase